MQNGPSETNAALEFAVNTLGVSCRMHKHRIKLINQWRNIFTLFSIFTRKLFMFLQVENILVIGHSGCGGIQALMSMQDDENPRFLTFLCSCKSAAAAADPTENLRTEFPLLDFVGL